MTQGLSCDPAVTYPSVDQRLTTPQVAKRLKIHRTTLEKWISDGRVPAPPLTKYKNRKERRWSEEDIQPVVALKRDTDQTRAYMRQRREEIAIDKQRRKAAREAKQGRGLPAIQR